MSADFTITVVLDAASPIVNKLSQIARLPSVREAMLAGCCDLTRAHIAALGRNKRGWRSSGFHREIARNGVQGELTPDGFDVLVSHPRIPGATRLRYYGGRVTAGRGVSWVTGEPTQYLTIPATAEAYGRASVLFRGLKILWGRRGPYALGATGRVTRDTYPQGPGYVVRRKRGQSPGDVRIFYWLKQSVLHKPDKGFLPSPRDYISRCRLVLDAVVADLIEGHA